MIVNFQRVVRKRKIRVACPGCGKKRYRVISVEETINPFNKNAEGKPKSQSEVYQSVTAKLDAECSGLKNMGIVCNACSPHWDKLAEQ